MKHTAISASAGSGKTFQLTNRYLQLIAAGAEPSTILASTFTRLAAGQIRDRILMRLARAADDPKESVELAQHLELKSLSPASAMELLSKLARQLHVMQVRTLDSFFAAIVQAFSLELQIPPGSEVVDEEQSIEMRREAIRLMLDEHVPQALVDLLRLLTQGASDRGITDKIDSVVGSLYELWQEAPPEAWECVPELDGRLSPPRLVAAIQKLEDVACPSGKSLSKAFKNDCENARGWRWSALLKNGIAGAIARGQEAYSRQPIPPELIAAYRPVVNHAIGEVIGRLRDQTVATRDLLSAFHVQYAAVKRRRRAITFSDLATALASAEKLGSLDEIAFRLDAKLAHLLLDEFQDTSIPQWRALEPLVREITSVAPPEKTFFCVGDVKQSIYRWRDAAPEVLEDLPDILRGINGESPITRRTLSRSYRSAPPIMEAVNRVFSTLDRNESLADFQEAAQAWSRGFQHHETAKDKLAGHVQLRYCKRAESDDEMVDAIRLRAAAELAAELHRSNPRISIAVLTRTNRAVAKLLYELGPSRLDIPATGRGGGPLIDAAPVNVVLDMLQLADHPDDTIAAFNVAMAPGQGQGLGVRDQGLEESAAGKNWWSDDRLRRRMARRIRREMLDDGYGRAIPRWVREMVCECDAREARRLRELINLADAFDSASSTGMRRSGDFIRLVEQTKIPDAQSMMGGPAVQVMTIHQAKGLEFDAVILAELGGKLTGANTPAVVVERESETGPITRICRYVNQDALEFVPELAPIFEHHTHRVVRETLSVLYVAMTRAIHGLYMIINPPDIKKDGSPSQRNVTSMAGVLSCALTEGNDEPDSIAFEIGNPDWHKTISSEVTVEADEPAIDGIQLAPPDKNQIARGASAEAASRTAARLHAPTLRQHLSINDSDALDRGLALHALFEQIQWLEEFQAEECQLLNIVRCKTPRRDEKWARAQVQAFLRCIRTPAIKQSLERGAADVSRVRLHRERPFARIVDGAIQTGFIDRMVVHLNGNCSIRSAMVIDFKTDSVEAGQAVAHGERYRSQMEAYRAATAELLGIDEAAVALRMLFVAAGAVVDLA